MKDYLQMLDHKIANQQENKFNEKRYLEGYIDALAEIRYSLRTLIEQRDEEQKKEVPQ
jgi:hypothetical protein